MLELTKIRNIGLELIEGIIADLPDPVAGYNSICTVIEYMQMMETECTDEKL